MPINKNELTKEMIAKFEVTKEEAEAYLAEMDDMELEEEALKKVAGGYNICENYGKACPSYINVG